MINEMISGPIKSISQRNGSKKSISI
jgi:hypothetical protein